MCGCVTHCQHCGLRREDCLAAGTCFFGRVEVPSGQFSDGGHVIFKPAVRADHTAGLRIGNPVAIAGHPWYLDVVAVEATGPGDMVTLHAVQGPFLVCRDWPCIPHPIADEDATECQIIEELHRKGTPMNHQAKVAKLARLTSLMRDIGSSYIDYIGPLTWLLFIKMRAEGGYDFGQWERIAKAPPSSMARAIEMVYGAHKPDNRPLSALQMVYAKAFNPWGDNVTSRSTLARIVTAIDAEDWTGDGDTKGDLYEALLGKGASDVRYGMGQYFTPRPLVQAIVDCIRPQPGETVHDPACGTGGFLVAAHAAAYGKPLREGGNHLYTGVEMVEPTARLAQMNTILHGAAHPACAPTITVEDALAQPGPAANIVLANPPFGARLSEPGDRPDWPLMPGTKEHAFLLHIAEQLQPGGRAAVIVPDGVLFGNGKGAQVRRYLLENLHVHTLLRLPTGIFYATGINASVLFFDKPLPGQSEPGKGADDLRMYDLRTGMDFTLKQSPITAEDFTGFVSGFHDRGVTGGRWYAFAAADILADPDASLDLKGPAPRPEESADPRDLNDAIVKDLREALAAMEGLAALLNTTMAPRDNSPAPVEAEWIPEHNSARTWEQGAIPLEDK